MTNEEQPVNYGHNLVIGDPFEITPATEDVSPVDRVRARLVAGLLFLFAATAGFACYAAFWGTSKQWSQVSDLMDVVLAAEISFVSAAVTFYMTRNLQTLNTPGGIGRRIVPLLLRYAQD